MSWKDKVVSTEKSYGIADYSVTFNDIDKMEEKRRNFVAESKAVHEAAVKQWDVLYEALKEIAEKYKDSAAFQDSQLYKHYFERAVAMDKKSSE